jgi:hypothetical protein
MGIRAIVLGLLLALFMCGYTYYNNQVLRQTFFVSNHLPIGVFGTLLVVVFVVNPVLRRIRPSFALHAWELAIMVALALAVCPWPCVNGFRNFTTAVTFPNHTYKVESGWRGAAGMSYVPGGSPLLAEGFVTDFPALARRLSEALSGEGDAALRAVAAKLPAYTRRTAEQAVVKVSLENSDRRALIAGLNELIEGPELASVLGVPTALLPELRKLQQEAEAAKARQAELLREREAVTGDAQEVNHRRKLLTHRAERALHEAELGKRRANRKLLEATFAGLITQAPEGAGVLLDNGHDDAFAVGSLVSGWGGAKRLGLFDLPWDLWWPTIRLWGAVAVLLGLAALCLALIVHPQWTRRELLPYPIVGFLRDVVQSDRPGLLPAICSSKLFWAGVGAMLAQNLLNGLHAWFPAVPEIPFRFDFSALQTLYPEVGRVGWSVGEVFAFRLYPLIIAFTYFIRSDVALSLGISNIAWTAIGVVFIANGVSLSNGDLGWAAADLVRMGGALGLAGVILFAGRRYYLNVVASAFGFRRHEETPSYSVWAARALLACILICLWVLQRYAGLSWLYGGTMVFAILLASLIMARLNAEGGVLLVAPGWSPTTLVPAVFGYGAIAPSQYFSMATMTTAVWGDPRGAAMPFLLNGLHAADSIGKAPPRRAAPLMAILLVLGFVVSLGVTFLFQYNLGANAADEWSRSWAIREPFDAITRQLARLAAHDELGSVVAMSDWQRLLAINPDNTALAWIGAGAICVVVFAVARMRLAWWPIHPIIFVVMALWHVTVLAYCFLIGWVIRVAVIKVGGARAYHVVKPLMIGIIAGELLSVMGWAIVGVVYYGVTGLTPAFYSILPN